MISAEVLDSAEIALFRAELRKFFIQHQRSMPWRLPDAHGQFDPYKIVVSEIMLQQTQVSRVTPFYEKFIESFPDVQSLANATLADVLRVWQGLGYNRRARYLLQTAGVVATVYHGKFPNDRKALESLPGIGEHTAGAILVYAFNEPAIFVETNIRTVFIHTFFKETDSVTDKQLLPLLAQTLTPDNPREFYWALMDYGASLKRSGIEASRASAHYKRQSPFAGSVRQVRGQVLRILINGPTTYQQLKTTITDERLPVILPALQQEGFIRQNGSYFELL